MEYYRRVAEEIATMELEQGTPSAQKFLLEHGTTQCYETLDVMFPVIKDMSDAYTGSETAESLGIKNVQDVLNERLFDVFVEVSDQDCLQKIADKWQVAEQKVEKAKWVQHIRGIMERYNINVSDIFPEDNSSIH